MMRESLLIQCLAPPWQNFMSALLGWFWFLIVPGKQLVFQENET